MSGIGGAEYRHVFAVETAPAIDFAVGERGLDAGLPRRVCLALPPPTVAGRRTKLKLELTVETITDIFI